MTAPLLYPIEQLRHIHVLPLMSPAARDHVNLKDTRHPTYWFGMRATPTSIPFIVAGLLPMTAAGGRIRGVWCDPQFRKRGHGARLMDELVSYARMHGMRRLTQLAASPKWWVEERGWTVTKPLADGKAWLEKAI